MGATPAFEGFGRWPVAGQRMGPKDFPDFKISIFQSRISQNLANVLHQSGSSKLRTFASFYGI